MLRLDDRRLLPALTLLLFVPIFFQLANGLYREQGSYFNSGGNLTLLPIPLSVAACYAGVVLLGGYAKARWALVTIFLTFMGMLLSTVLLTSDHGSNERAKLILVIQYVLPMFALVLGCQYGARKEALSSLGNVLFWLLIFVVPLQLISTLSRGMGYLSPSLYLFSAYQHLQYVPVLLVGAFLIALFSLWEKLGFRPWLLVLSLFMGLYAALSVSMLTMGLLMAGMLCFSVRNLILGVAGWKAVLTMLCAIATLLLGFFYMANANILRGKFGFGLEGGFLDGGPQNVQERLFYWRYYFAGITESPLALLFGHLEAPDRSKYPSAHNYYLDFVYNFGLLAIFPLLSLIGYTVYGSFRNLCKVWNSAAITGLAGVVAFLLLADNSLKVGMRQPYSGIITFFLWGVLLAILLEFGKRHGSDDEARG